MNPTEMQLLVDPDNFREQRLIAEHILVPTPKLPSHGLFQHELGGDEVLYSLEDTLLMGQMVCDYFLEDTSPLVEFDFRDLLDAVEWVWKTERGTLPRRIAKWYHQRYKRRKGLTDELINDLGNVASNIMPKPVNYHMDITKDLNWKQGQFGDLNSCFFSGNAETRNRMNATPNLYAFRLFREVEKIYGKIPERNIDGTWYEHGDNYYVGSSRAWLLMKTTPHGPVYLLFNSYGMNLNKTAKIFAAHFQLESEEINLRGGALYINGGRAIAIGKKAAINHVKPSTSLDLSNNNGIYNEIPAGARNANYIGPLANALENMQGLRWQEAVAIPEAMTIN